MTTEPDNILRGGAGLWNDFKRLHVLPRRYGRYAVRGTLLEQLRDQSPRQRYIEAESVRRFAQRPDAYLPSLTPLPCEFGIIEGFRFITSPPPG